MKIKKMTATFGCLDGQTLELSGGTDLMVLPNESGKSTWAAFIIAMFYGLDPKRSAKGRLSDKERYTPWNGKAMEGLMELTMEGRTIVLQRTSEKGRLFSHLRAWDKNTGLEIPSITAENCGLQLLGVEREVFARSAFLRGSELMVTPDHDLSRRLGSLAAAGRETDSFLQTDDTLRTWQNRLRYHQSGAIPKLEKQIALLEDAPEPPKTDHLPPEQELVQLLGQLHSAKTEHMEPPAALVGLPREQIVPKVQADLKNHMAATVLLGAVLVLFAVLGAVLSPWCFVGCAAAAVAEGWHLMSGTLAKSYGAGRTGEVLPIAMQWLAHEQQMEKQAAILEKVRDFAPDAFTFHEGVQALEQAICVHHLAASCPEPDPHAAQRLQQELQELERRERAIILARQALAAANEQMQKTYVPMLTKLAGQYLSKLTLGRYDKLVMNEDLELSVKEQDGMLRPIAALSSGTKDQTWLALRLAMTQLLLPKGAPVVLDDALLTFDEERLAAAMEVLRQEDRQTIIFSCR